jgi:hypothetical protein
MGPLRASLWRGPRPAPGIASALRARADKGGGKRRAIFRLLERAGSTRRQRSTARRGRSPARPARRQCHGREQRRVAGSGVDDPAERHRRRRLAGSVGPGRASDRSRCVLRNCHDVIPVRAIVALTSGGAIAATNIVDGPGRRGSSGTQGLLRSRLAVLAAWQKWRQCAGRM